MLLLPQYHSGSMRINQALLHTSVVAPQYDADRLTRTSCSENTGENKSPNNHLCSLPMSVFYYRIVAFCSPACQTRSTQS